MKCVCVSNRIEVFTHLLCRLILTLVQREHPALGRHLEAACTEPYFATSWLITWLSHDISE